MLSAPLVTTSLSFPLRWLCTDKRAIPSTRSSGLMKRVDLFNIEDCVSICTASAS
ncbi:uncharacterized protein LACBIDRAFT_306046 [Laccaria bicolor S238N-H82]|uniref:Predicted protein n=1 Tax=Laccaria bicolor (strain S238N-H82 / ATCC MYA-4686) TaxID=486041 RepID=B0CSL1_LACBS|nr:uncharacterized protein LACBIDRAFT_306046 [Laccaria bicolor S238N-H82]EDR14862.1 predicted protein [Laccaria bicolor S238N-H82]|eukprot:XP_001875421.1 predicted protein [Laccaria bicolor S238N-H82]